MKFVEILQRRAKRLKAMTYAVYLAYKDPRTPWYAKVLAICVVSYFVSPIDLIPDFIPVLGQLDDLLIVPLGVALVIKLIPADVMAECQAKAEAAIERNKIAGWISTVVILIIWAALAALFVSALTHHT